MTILIADDDPSSLMVLQLNLEALGYDVVTARDGETAWGLLQDDRRIELVISDWMMPGLDGIEFCRLVRALTDRPYIYFLLLTARSLREDRLAGLDAGADDILTKPFDRDELVARLNVARRLLTAQVELRDRSEALERAQAELVRQNEQLAELATSDGLTGLKNHRYFRAMLDLGVSFAVRQGLPLTLIMLDVDAFKSYNDTFGHPAGDEVLTLLARTLRENVRDHDLVARYGGEEFALLLPATDAAAGRSIGERIRSAIAAAPWPIRPVTASLGVATTGPLVTTSTTLLDLADRALYHAKAIGKDCVVHSLDITPRSALGLEPFRLIVGGDRGD